MAVRIRCIQRSFTSPRPLAGHLLETRVVSRQATGDTTLALADLGAITLGLDISAPMLQRAESRAELGEDTRESADMLKVIAEEVREAYARIQERLD